MDMMKLMKQAQQMQSRMADMQAELEAATTEGQSGAGMVKVTLTGKGQMKGISIDPSLMREEEKDILEDLIMAAHADAMVKNARIMEEKMKTATAGMPIPPGMKLF
ncbi:MAG: YbaB/EbfC family nucleoid-associated protein [Beijerinckiaceae bacterium]